MEQTIYNDDNLKDNEIDEIVTRVKVFIINSNNEILLATSNGGYQLPGGHVEENESLYETVIREIQEETGIILNKTEIIDPFYEVKHYIRNYKNTGINRIAGIIYFLVKSDKSPDATKTNLTDNEKMNKFNIEYVKLSEFKNKIEYVQENNEKEINRVIAKEILVSFKYLKNVLNK